MANRQITTTQLIDVLAAAASLLYLQSVLTVAHHAQWGIITNTNYSVEKPVVIVLLVGLALCAYSWRKIRKPSVLVIITLTVLAVLPIFWLSGLRANFSS